ncbi:outer membrane beta-barrel protein, partial [Pedobacter steynii]
VLLGSISDLRCFNQLGTASLGCFRIYRETLSRFVRRFMEFKNVLKVNNNKEIAVVSDLESNGGYVENSYLTNKSNYNTLSERPAIGFLKSFRKYLSNRYFKSLNLNVFTEGEVFYQKNVSEKVFQRIHEFNFRFLPSASVSYTHNKTNTFNRTYSLNYTTSANYPNVYQLAPLTDSSNVYFLHFGNANLKSDYKQRLEFSFVHYGTRVGSTGSVNLKFWISKIGNYIGDSSRYDALGRRMHYNVNVNGYHDAGYRANWQKAFKMKENLLELMFVSELNYANTPAYINGDKVLQKNLNSYNWLRLSYNFNSLITISGSQSISTGTTRQEGNVNYSYKNFGTAGGVSVVWPKSLYWNTNINFNRSTSDYSKPINFAIWNASIAYRFLKGENAEIKVSALDLLGQNKSIINYGYNNSISTGSVNVLQQYFMLTLAYYPRFFGSTEKKNP